MTGNNILKKTRKQVFADVIIVVCVAVSGVITFDVLWEYHRLNTAVPSGVVTALLGFWGGELLIVAIRQIFGSDVVAKAKQGFTDGESI